MHLSYWSSRYEKNGWLNMGTVMGRGKMTWGGGEEGGLYIKIWHRMNEAATVNYRNGGEIK